MFIYAIYTDGDTFIVFGSISYYLNTRATLAYERNKIESLCFPIALYNDQNNLKVCDKRRFNIHVIKTHS